MPERVAAASHRWICCVATVATGLAALSPPASAEVVGGGFSVVKEDSGRHWFVRTSDGAQFMSIGVSNVSEKQHLPRPGTHYYDPLARQFGGDLAAWASSCAQTLISTNFNTVGCWSNPEITGPGLLHTPVLYVAGFESDRCLAGLRPGFEAMVESRTLEVMAPYKGRTDVLGVFLCNEMPWWGRTAWDVLPTYTMLERAIELDESDPARVAAIDLLKKRHGTPAKLSEAYGVSITDWSQINLQLLRTCNTAAAKEDRAAFGALAAEEFHARSTAVVRRLLPGVLVFSNRYAGDAPEAVIRASGKYCDVIAVNSYSPNPDSTKRLLARYWLLTGKPAMITEFSWRAMENQSGNPNKRGAGAALKTQQDRADKFREFVTEIAPEPMVIGYHWFQWADQSPQGRFDGEDSNYGIVDIEHRPYETLQSTMREFNAQAANFHRASTRALPTSMPTSHGVTYTPGQHPDRPPTMSLMRDWAGPHELWHAVDAKGEVSFESDVMMVKFSTGNEYGVGVSVRGPSSQLIEGGPPFATDLDGYEYITLDAEIPEGVEINLCVNEAGADAPWKPFDTSAGDDGESYRSLPMIGKGVRHVYRVRIADLAPQSSWGNQSGVRRIDMNAVGTVAVQLGGPALSGTARVYGLSLER